MIHIHIHHHHQNTIINLYRQPDCFGIKSEIYNSQFCQAAGIPPYSNQSKAQKNMCSDLVKGICQVTDEFTKDSLVEHNPLLRELYIPLNPCKDSFDTVHNLFQKNTIANRITAFLYLVMALT